MTEPKNGTSTLPPGTMVGEYQISHLLGEGGMGMVYAGTHPEIGKRVAIKVLAPHAAHHVDLIRRFKEEARAVNKIRHPNIIDIFAFNQLPDGRHYFVMEYLEGESLTARLQRGSMTFSEMRRLLTQICGALEAAHEAGVIHRDLKPDNIWVAKQHLSESRIKLLDFGIAKLNDLTNSKATQTGVSMGTPHYMAPEQAMGRPVDERADIYALGVILYQIFAGTLPFDGVTTHEIVFKHLSEVPVPPSSHRAIIPAEMERIILDCLEKTRERRPVSIAELSKRIEAAFAAREVAGAWPGEAALIPRVPAAASYSPAQVRTKILPESGRVPGLTAALPLSSTTLRESTGERVVTDEVPAATQLPAVARSGLTKAATGVGVVVLVTIGVGIGVRQRRSSEASSPVGQPAATTFAPTGPALLPAERLAPAEVAPSLPHTATAATSPVVAPASTATTRSEHSRKSAPKTSTAMVMSSKGPSGPRHDTARTPTASTATVAKPNCKPNFYLDASFEKHFKPECF